MQSTLPFNAVEVMNYTSGGMYKDICCCITVADFKLFCSFNRTLNRRHNQPNNQFVTHNGWSAHISIDVIYMYVTKVEILAWQAIQCEIATRPELLRRNILREFSRVTSIFLFEPDQTPNHIQLHCQFGWGIYGLPSCNDGKFYWASTS